jgi:hypothetical protein
MDNATTEHLVAIVLGVMSLGPLALLTLYCVIAWRIEVAWKD